MQRGLRIATIKHAHHAFDVDQPGKDSYEHRKAGASEVIVSSARRWVVMHELGDAAEASLAHLLRKISSCDLILVEGFKREPLPKIEVFRSAVGKPALHVEDARIVAIASDEALPSARVPVVDLNDAAAVSDLVCERAEPLATRPCGARSLDLRPACAFSLRRDSKQVILKHLSYNAAP